MSELGEIHEKVNAMGKGVARIEGILDTALPTLATKDHVDLKIAEHAAVKPSLLPIANGGTRKIVALSGVVVALSGLLIYLVKMIVF